MTEPTPHPIKPDASGKPAARRVDAVRHLLKPHQVREGMALATQPFLHNSSLVGLQSALTTAIALPLAYLSPWPHLVGFAALGALVALFGRLAPTASRNRIVLMCALCQILAVLTMSTASWLGAPPAAQLILLAFACGIFFFTTVTWQFGAPGALIFVFAAGASMGHVDSWLTVVERTAATAVVAALAYAICAMTEVFRRQAMSGASFPSESARPVGHRLIAATRIVLGSGLSAFAAYAVGAAHPAWAAMGTLAVMQGTHLHISMNRALQRMSGTVVGAVLVWMILIQAPSVWIVILLVVLLQIATEMIIGTNYALGQIMVTPMALLMSYLAAPLAAGAAMAPERVMDTLLGCCIGIVLAVLFSTLDDRLHLADHHATRTGRRSQG
ncbi:FUSC family protein [Roseococcus sp.]|uniref:FUSC family protein n=1 Tax=Roseococcus sp. TaxID=2109646 RepID=UPI003BAAD7C9